MKNFMRCAGEGVWYFWTQKYQTMKYLPLSKCEIIYFVNCEIFRLGGK